MHLTRNEGEEKKPPINILEASMPGRADINFWAAFT
jgi:hypothetical protein